MFRNRVVSLAAAVAAAVLLLASGPALPAGPSGSGHGGGGHSSSGGGYGSSGYSGGSSYHGGSGSYHSGYSGSYHSGYSGYEHHGYYPGYYPYGLGYYPWYGYRRYPYTSYSGYGPSYYPAYDAATVPVDPGLYPSAAGDPSAASTVLVNVWVPENAEVWFQGRKTAQAGGFRQFISPPLKPGVDYTYEVRARWTQNGQVVDRTKTISVRAGTPANVNFLPSAPTS